MLILRNTIHIQYFSILVPPIDSLSNASGRQHIISDLHTMSIDYTNRFYNHFENSLYDTSVLDNPIPKINEENLMLRYKAKIPFYDFQQNSLTIRYFKLGCGKLVRRRQVLNIKDGQFLVLNPNEGWTYHNERNDYIDVLSFGLTTELVDNFSFYSTSETIKLLDNPNGQPTTNLHFFEGNLNSDYYNSGRLLKHMFHLSNTSKFTMTSAEEWSYEILRALTLDQKWGQKMARNIASKKTSTKAETLKRLLIAYEFIHDNIKKPISIKELSYEASLSRFHLYDSFKKTFGKTPHQYINRLKLERAKDLLKSTDISITEVAHTFGFNDSSVFTKVFKKKYGYPPSQLSRDT